MEIITTNTNNVDEVTIDLTKEVESTAVVYMYLLGSDAKLRLQGLDVRFAAKHLPKLIEEAIAVHNEACGDNVNFETLSLVGSDD